MNRNPSSLFLLKPIAGKTPLNVLNFFLFKNEVQTITRG